MVLSQFEIDISDRGSQLRLDHRLALQFLADAGRRLVQYLPEHLGVPAQGKGGADALEHVLEEIGDLPAPGGLGLCTNRLPGACDHTGHEQECRRPERSGEGAVPGAPAPGPLGNVWRAGQDRLTLGEAPQFVRKVLSGGIATGRVFVEALEAYRFQVSGHAWVQGTRGNRLMVNNQMQGVRDRACGKRRPLRQQVVKDCAGGVNVAVRADNGGLGLRLFRRYEARGAKDLPACGQMRIEPLATRETEVGYPRLIEDVDQDVGGFKVTVQGAVFVSKVNRVGDRPHVLGSLLCRQRLLTRQFLEIAALDEIHRIITCGRRERPLRGRRRYLDAASWRRSRASWTNLLTSASLARRPARIIFRATSRSRLTCLALYTTPMPPRPISAPIS